MGGRVSAMEALFGVRDEERETAGLLFIACFCAVSAAFVVGRTLGVTLFLQRVDPAYLPYTYALSAAGTSTVALIYAQVADRFARHRTIQVTALLFAALAVILRLALNDSLVFLAAVYVFFDIVGDLTLLQLWTLASDVISARQGKRLYPFVAAGGTVGGALSGVLLGASVEHLGTANLFFVVAALLLASAAACTRIGRLHDLEPPPPAKRSGRRSSAGVGPVLSDPYTRTLGALFAVATCATILVDYQWKLSARAEYLGDEEALAAYFSFFAVATNSVALFVQLFVTGRLLERFGLRAGLSVLPTSLLFALGGGLLAGSASAFATTTAAKGVDGALRYSVNDTSALVLYRPIPSRLRGRAKAIVSGVLKPVAAGLMGLALAALTTWLAPEQLSYVTAPLVAVWIALAWWMRRAYVSRLASELGRHDRLAADSLVLDKHTRAALLEALESDSAQRQLGALALLSEFEELPPELPLEHLLSGGDAEVAARCLELLCRHPAEDAHFDPTPILAATESEQPEVRGRAVAVLLRRGDLASVLNAASRLTEMIESEDPRARSAAAGALSLVGEPRFHEPLLRLLSDEQSAVRVAAARAAAAVPHPALVPELAPLLSDPSTRAAGRLALSAIGDPSVPALARALTAHDDQAHGVALVAAQTLGDIGTDSAQEALASALASPERTVARAAARTLGKLAESGPVAIERASIETLLRAEIGAGERARALVSALRDAESELLGDALEQRWRRSAGHTLSLASTLAPGRPFERIERALLSTDTNQRAHALELLDNTAIGATKDPLIALFEKPPAALDDAATRDTRLRELLEDDEPWVVACTVYELALAGALQPGDAKGHTDPLVVGTRQLALAGVLVRRVGKNASVRMVGTGPAHSGTEENAMISIVERVLFLKGVDFFADIPSELLVSVARLAVEQYFEPQEALIREGDDGDCIFLIVEGHVAIETGGREVASLGRKECVGEMSLLDSEPRSATVTAKTTTLCLRVDQGPFFELLAERPELMRGLIGVLSRRLRQMVRDRGRITMV